MSMFGSGTTSDANSDASSFLGILEALGGILEFVKGRESELRVSVKLRSGEGCT